MRTNYFHRVYKMIIMLFIKRYILINLKKPSCQDATIFLYKLSFCNERHAARNNSKVKISLAFGNKLSLLSFVFLLQ